MVDIDALDLDLYRFDLHPIALMAGSNDPIQALRGISEWLGKSGMSAISLFVFSCRFVIDMLDLDLYRHDLDPTVSPSPSNESNDSVRTFQGVFGWLRCVSTSMVSLFDFERLADFSRFNLDSSTSTSTPDVSIRMICRVYGWHGRHK